MSNWQKLRVHVDYKSGGDYDFLDVAKVEITTSRMLFIDYLDGTRHTEHFDKIERISIQVWNKEFLKGFIVIEMHGPVMIVKRLEAIEKGKSEDKKEL